MTLTVRLAVAVAPPPSVTLSTTVLSPSVAEQSAATVAVTSPVEELGALIEVMLMPAGALITVRTKSCLGVSASSTVAIVAVVPALPCRRIAVAPAVIVGFEFPDKAFLHCKNSDVLPRASVAVEVNTCPLVIVGAVTSNEYCPTPVWIAVACPRKVRPCP